MKAVAHLQGPHLHHRRAARAARRRAERAAVNETITSCELSLADLLKAASHTSP